MIKETVINLFDDLKLMEIDMGNRYSHSPGDIIFQIDYYKKSGKFYSSQFYKVVDHNMRYSESTEKFLTIAYKTYETLISYIENNMNFPYAILSAPFEQNTIYPPVHITGVNIKEED